MCYCDFMDFMDKRDILQKIKLRRVALGLSQDDVAHATNIDRSQYSRIERGDYDLSLTNLMKITGFLGLKFSDLDDNGSKLPRTDLDTAEGVQRELQALREMVKALEKRIDQPKVTVELPEPPTEAFKQFLKTKPNEAEVRKWLNEITQPLRDNKRKKSSK